MPTINPDSAMRAGVRVLTNFARTQLPRHSLPHWELYIRKPLNLGSMCDCVLGQVFGHFDHGMKLLFPSQSRTRVITFVDGHPLTEKVDLMGYWSASEAHGFSVPSFPPDVTVQDAVRYAFTLEELWSDYLTFWRSAHPHWQTYPQIPIPQPPQLPQVIVPPQSLSTVPDEGREP